MAVRGPPVVYGKNRGWLIQHVGNTGSKSCLDPSYKDRAVVPVPSTPRPSSLSSCLRKVVGRLPFPLKRRACGQTVIASCRSFAFVSISIISVLFL